MAGNFAMFVKQHYPEVAHLPPKQRLKALSVMYKKGRTVKGGGILSGILDSVGLGLPEAEQGGVLTAAGLPVKKRGRKAKGGGILSGILDSVGLGLPEAEGGVLTAAGLPMKKRRARKARGGDVEGGGLLSGILDSVGLGLPVEQGAGLRHRGASSSARAPKHTGGYGYVPPSVPVDKQYSAGTAPFPRMSSTTRQVMGARLHSEGQSYQGRGMVLTPRKQEAMGGGLEDFFSGVGGALPVKKRGRKAKGGGILSGILDSVGLGLPEAEGGVLTAAGLPMKKRRARKARGGVLTAAGLPTKKRRARKARGGDVEGGGIVSGLLEHFGL